MCVYLCVLVMYDCVFWVCLHLNVLFLLSLADLWIDIGECSCAYYVCVCLFFECLCVCEGLFGITTLSLYLQSSCFAKIFTHFLQILKNAEQIFYPSSPKIQIRRMIMKTCFFPSRYVFTIFHITEIVWWNRKYNGHSVIYIKMIFYIW